jgi:hypothetical protein
MVRGVTDRTRGEIGRIMATAAQRGMTRAQVSARVVGLLQSNAPRHARSRFGSWQYQVERIYRTETRVLYSAAQDAAGKAWRKRTGEPMVKVWQHYQGGNVMARPSHVAMHNQERPLHRMYSNGMQHPHDPRFGPRENCNCMCYQLIVPARLKDELPRAEKPEEG